MSYLLIEDGGVVTIAGGQVPQYQVGLDAGKPASPNMGDKYTATDTGKSYTCFVAGVWSDSTPPAVNNIQNPGFEFGTANWTFFPGTLGAGVFTSDATNPYEYAKRAKIVCTTLKADTQLYQDDIPLQPSTLYRLSFAAYCQASIINVLKVEIMKQSAPYADYGLGLYQPALNVASWKFFTTTFTSDIGASIDARLAFNFSDGVDGDIFYIDSVKLEKVI